MILKIICYVGVLACVVGAAVLTVDTIVNAVHNHKFRAKHNGSQWNVSGILVLNMLRAEINQYAKQIHERLDDPDVVRGEAEAQEITCYEILRELDRALHEAYDVELDFDPMYTKNGMTVKDLMYALSACDLSRSVFISGEKSTTPVSMLAKNVSGNVLLVGESELAE